MWVFFSKHFLVRGHDIRIISGYQFYIFWFDFSVIHQYYLTPNGYLDDETFLSRDITKFFLDFLGAHDQGETLAIAVEEKYLGRNNMGNLTAMVPGIIDVISTCFLRHSLCKLFLLEIFTSMLSMEICNVHLIFFSFNFCIIRER